LKAEVRSQAFETLAYTPGGGSIALRSTHADGHVHGSPRNAFWKSGAGGFGILVVPSLDLAIYKWPVRNGNTIRRSRDCRSSINALSRWWRRHCCN